MVDQVQKLFVKSFIGYLKGQVEGNILATDALESVEVAIQCLQAAFDLDGEEEVTAPPTAGSSDSTATTSTPITENDIDLFEMFQSLFILRNPQSLEMAEQIKNEGNRLMKEGKYHEALVQYNRALAFDPRNPIFYCNRAAACIRLGENENAVRDCKSALAFNPSYGKAFGRMGIAYSNLGKFDDAQQAYTKAIELEPDNQDYRTNLEVAKNQRTTAAAVPQFNMPTQITEIMNSVLSNPAYRELFNDLSLQRNDPRLMNIFQSLRGGAAAGEGGFDSDGLMQILQTVVSEISRAQEQLPEDPSRQPPPQS